MRPKILAIIPARGGSKEIPRKNVRLLAGKPLISYIITVAKNSSFISDVLVITDDPEIANIASLYGVKTIKEPAYLAKDNITLDPVVFYALKIAEKNKKTVYDFVITLQPTTPLLKADTLDKAIKKMIKSSYDTLISANAERRLFWLKKEEKFIPFYKERKNRQFLEPVYKENGAIVISRRKIITPRSRIGGKICIYEIPLEESIDIDNYLDWWVAEGLLNKLTIIFRAEGNLQIGLGHIYRALTLVNRIFNHKCIFVTNIKNKLGLNKLKEYNYPIITYINEQDLFKKLKKIKPHIIINDILDTEESYILKLKKMGIFVVNFEDLGPGAKVADLVINALYENSNPPPNHYYGYKYECLRDEFIIFPAKKIKKKVKNILITFGGTDPKNLTKKTLQAIEKLNFKNIKVQVILGLGVSQFEQINKYVKRLNRKGYKIDVQHNIVNMAYYINQADLVITSNGRTIYEVATLGVPCISISQNTRELKHLFSILSFGIKHLGLAEIVSVEELASVIKKIVNNYSLRKEMSKNLLSFSLKEGTDRVLKLILDNYYQWKNNR